MSKVTRKHKEMLENNYWDIYPTPLYILIPGMLNPTKNKFVITIYNCQSSGDLRGK